MNPAVGEQIGKHIIQHRKFYLGVVGGYLASRRIKITAPPNPTFEKEIINDFLDFLHMKDLNKEFDTFHRKRISMRKNSQDLHGI